MFVGVQMKLLGLLVASNKQSEEKTHRHRIDHLVR